MSSVLWFREEGSASIYAIIVIIALIVIAGFVSLHHNVQVQETAMNSLKSAGLSDDQAEQFLNQYGDDFVFPWEDTIDYDSPQIQEFARHWAENHSLWDKLLKGGLTEHTAQEALQGNVDGDNMINIEDSNPLKHNSPVTSYAEDKGFSKELIKKLEPLNRDLNLDGNEMALINNLAGLPEKIIKLPKLKEKLSTITEDNQVLEEELKYFEEVSEASKSDPSLANYLIQENLALEAQKGFLTWPTYHDAKISDVWGYDYDLRENRIMDKDGNTAVGIKSDNLEVGDGHNAIDIYMPEGEKILAPAAGTVASVYYNQGISINLNPSTELEPDIFNLDNYNIDLAHMEKATVEEGEKVERGEVVGISGGEVGHLHFGIHAVDVKEAGVYRTDYGCEDRGVVPIFKDPTDPDSKSMWAGGRPIAYTENGDLKYFNVDFPDNQPSCNVSKEFFEEYFD